MAKGQVKQAQIKIDKAQFESLCSLQCTRDEICAVFGVDDNTLIDWCKNTYGTDFRTIFKQKRMLGKTSLRRSQWLSATKGGNVTMQIFLGKNMLGQSDNPENSSEFDGDNIIVVVPAKDISKAFVDVNRAIDDRDYREYYMEGGRGSTKSSFVSEKMIEILENNPKMCAVVLRKVKDTLKDSVYAQLEWAIDKMGEVYPKIKEDYKLTKSPLEITKISTGQKIYFRGADDYGKIKSLKPPMNMYIGVTWYEEFDQFNGMNEVRKINQSLIRGGEDFIQFYTYNTPASALHFVNVEKIIPKESRLVHLSDYRSVPKKWLGQAFIDEAEYLKEVNEKLYENEYLGLCTGTGGLVFENVELREISDEEINNFDYIYMGMDFGWFPDPLAWTKCCFDSSRRTLYIFDEFVINKMSNADVWEYLKENKGVKDGDLIIADSAEPKSIGDFRSYGCSMRGAEKGPRKCRIFNEMVECISEDCN